MNPWKILHIIYTEDVYVVHPASQDLVSSKISTVTSFWASFLGIPVLALRIRKSQPKCSSRHLRRSNRVVLRLLRPQRCSTGRLWASRWLREEKFSGSVCNSHVLDAWFTQTYHLQLMLVFIFGRRKLVTVSHPCHIAIMTLTQGGRRWRFSSRIYHRDQSISGASTRQIPAFISFIDRPEDVFDIWADGFSHNIKNSRKICLRSLASVQQ